MYYLTSRNKLKIVYNIFLWPALPPFASVIFVCFCFSLSLSCWNAWSFKRKTSKVDWKFSSSMEESYRWRALLQAGREKSWSFPRMYFLLDWSVFPERNPPLSSPSENETSHQHFGREEIKLGSHCSVFRLSPETFLFSSYPLSVHSAQLSSNPDLSQFC